MVSNPKTPDCGPHCKVVPGKVYGPLRTIRIRHCKKRKCTQCHRKVQLHAAETQEGAAVSHVQAADELVRGPLEVREHQSARSRHRSWHHDRRKDAEEEEEVVDKPKVQEFCKVCGQPMKWFGDHWKCTMIKVHDHASNAQGSSAMKRGT